MLNWWRHIRRLWRRPKETPQPPNHLGGRGIPKILGICESCGAVVIEGLHQPTPTGFLCQRCASTSRNRAE